MVQNNQPHEDVVKIIRECQAGSHEAFRCLVERYQRVAYGIAYHMLHSEELAKDISQEAFIRVFYSIRRFDLTRSFYTWLYHIVVRLCIDYLRGHRPHETIDPVSIQDPSSKSPVEQLIKDEEHRTIKETLETLPPKYKAVMVLRDIEGLSSCEVARILKCSDGVVRWTLCEARKRFKEAWLKRRKTQNHNLMGEVEA